MDANFRIPLFIRITQWNRLTWAVLLHSLKANRLDSLFEISFISNMQGFEVLLSLNKIAVILYSFMTVHVVDVIPEITYIKNKLPGRTILIAGGPHPTGEPEGTVKLGFDHVLSGDGEEMLPVLLWNIYEEHVAGDGHVKSDGAASRQTILLSKIHRPPPLTTLDSSFPIDPIHGLTAPLELTRGCRWRCTFCQTGSLRTRPVSRSLDSVKEYALELKRRNFTRINFISPTALEYGSASPEAPSPDCVASVLETSRNYGMTRIEFGIFPTEIRPESLSPLMAKILKTYCSHRHLTIGAQSGCSTMLKKLKRGHTLNHVEHAAANALNAGFLPMIDIILGAPDETYEHRLATLKWMKTMNRLVRAMFQVHYFLPLAGSESWGKLPSPLENDIQTELIKMQTAGFVKGFWQADILLYKKLESYLLNQSDSDSE